MAGNRKVLPMEEDNYVRFIRTAINMRNDETADFGEKDLLMVLLPACCGLRIGEVAHLSAKWITHTNNGPAIRIPKKWPCTLGRSGSCARCKAESSFYDDPSLWGPKTKGRWPEKGAYPIPLTNTLTDAVTGDEVETNLANRLISYFKVHDQLGVAGYETIRFRVRRVAQQTKDLHLDHGRGLVNRLVAKNDRQTVPDLHPHDLRGSWACHCLRRQISDYTLRDWGGWQDLDMINYYSSFVGDVDGSGRDKL